MNSLEESEVDRPEVKRSLLAEYDPVDGPLSDVSIEEDSGSIEVVGRESVVEETSLLELVGISRSVAESVVSTNEGSSGRVV